MIVYEPQTKLSIGSDAKHSEGREIYKRDSADRLLEVLHKASTKSVAQLRAGKTTLTKLNLLRFLSAALGSKGTSPLG